MTVTAVLDICSIRCAASILWMGDGGLWQRSGWSYQKVDADQYEIRRCRHTVYLEKVQVNETGVVLLDQRELAIDFFLPGTVHLLN